MDPMRFLILARDILKVNTENYNSNDEIVAIIGGKNSGKSSLINCLMRNPLKVVTSKTRKEYYLEQVDPNNRPEIGPYLEDNIAGQSGTTWSIWDFPWLGWLYQGKEEQKSLEECDTELQEHEINAPSQFGTLPGTQCPMWEIPWFGDEFEHELSSVYDFFNILKPSNGIRFILVIPYNVIADKNPMQFFDILNNLRNITCDIYQSLVIVASKGKKDDLKNQLVRLSKVTIKNLTDKDLLKVAEVQNILKHVLNNERYFNFKAPSGKEGSIYNLKDEQLLLAAINRTPSLKLYKPMVFSDFAKDFFEDFHKIIITAFESYSDDYIKETKEYGRYKIEESNGNVENLSELHKYLEAILQMPISKKITELNKIVSGIKKAVDFLRVADTIEQIFRDINEDCGHCSRLFEVRLNETLLEIMLDVSVKLNKTVEEVQQKRTELERLREEKLKLVEENKKIFGIEAWECACDRKMYIADSLIEAATVPWKEFNPLVKDLLQLQRVLQFIRSK